MTIPEKMTNVFDYNEMMFLVELSRRTNEIFEEQTQLEQEQGAHLDLKGLYNKMYPDDEWECVQVMNNDTNTARAFINKRKRKTNQYTIAFWGKPDNTSETMAYPSITIEPEPPQGGIRVHHGQKVAFETLETQIESFFNTTQVYGEDSKHGRPLEIYVTGHGSGGCLAMLCALYFKRFWSAKIDFPAFSLKMYNFGSPKLGNSAFVNYYDKHMKGFSYRVQNLLDLSVYEPLPDAPPIYGCQLMHPGVDYLRRGDKYYTLYQHVGQAYTVVGLGKPISDSGLVNPSKVDIRAQFRHSTEDYQKILTEARKYYDSFWAPFQNVIETISKGQEEISSAFQDAVIQTQRALSDFLNPTSQ